MNLGLGLAELRREAERRRRLHLSAWIKQALGFQPHETQKLPETETMKEVPPIEQPLDEAA
jgi:hypothetical protein